jgi:hypothetical protein
VHKDSIAACARVDGRESIETFGATSREILRPGDWMASLGVTHVALEATGVFWRPVWNLLEGRSELVLVNARHVKGGGRSPSRRVPGRETDVTDGQWIARLMGHGLLRASLVPMRP